MARTRKRVNSDPGQARREAVRRPARKRKSAKKARSGRRPASRKRGAARDAGVTLSNAPLPPAATSPPQLPTPWRNATSVLAMASPNEGRGLCGPAPPAMDPPPRLPRCRCGHITMPGEGPCYECGRGD